MNTTARAICQAGIRARLFDSDHVRSIPKRKGAYLLLLRLDEPVSLELRNRPASVLDPGWVVYAGSANGPGGLQSRLTRHFRTTKTCHWHIDRLTAACAEISAMPVIGGEECDLMDALLHSDGFEIAVEGFGNTDCRRCSSHLARYTAFER